MHWKRPWSSLGHNSNIIITFSFFFFLAYWQDVMNRTSNAWMNCSQRYTGIPSPPLFPVIYYLLYTQMYCVITLPYLFAWLLRCKVISPATSLRVISTNALLSITRKTTTKRLTSHSKLHQRVHGLSTMHALTSIDYKSPTKICW